MNTSLNADKTPVTNVNFLAHGFRGVGAREMPWVTGFPNDPQSVQHKLWGGRKLFPLPWFIRPDHNNYVAVSSFKPGDDGLFHRRKDNFSRMHMVMVDDVGTKIPHDKLLLPPSVLVETSPGNFQGWYFLNPPEADRDKAERLINGMIATGLTADSSDPGMKGVTRYGRLPVGVNSKAKYVAKLGAPFVQRIATWAPTTRYSIDEIAAAYGVNMSVQPSRLAPRPLRHAPRKPTTPGLAGSEDGFVELLARADLYRQMASSLDGAHFIICPWVHEHTGEDQSGTIYFEPSDQNDWKGGFKCHHGHCQERNITDLTYFLIRRQQLLAGKQ